MPAWLISLISSLALPLLKQVLVVSLKALERWYPGISSLVDQIINFIDGGGSAAQLKSHCNGLVGFCPKP